MCIHPFEDGNGRIGRALAEKSLAQNLGQPSLIALAYTIERKRKDYYAALERNNKELRIDGWQAYTPRVKAADTPRPAPAPVFGRRRTGYSKRL